MHLLNCYQEQPSISLADQLLAEGVEEPLQQHSALRYGLQPEQINVEPGLPEYVIPHQAKKHHANIVTLGAGEHHGLIDLLKGHACEYVVDGLVCDALILKANRCNEQ